MSRLDINQIANMTLDADKKASKVSIVDADIQIELSHEDGDSIISKKQTIAQKLSNNSMLDVSDCSKICSSHDITLESVLEDGTTLFEIVLKKGIPQDICSILIKNSSGQEVTLLLQ